MEFDADTRPYASFDEPIPKDILMTISVYHLAIEVPIEFDRYFDSHDSIGTPIAELYKPIVVKMSLGIVTWVRFPPPVKGLRSEKERERERERVRARKRNRARERERERE